MYSGKKKKKSKPVLAWFLPIQYFKCSKGACFYWNLFLFAHSGKKIIYYKQHIQDLNKYQWHELSCIFLFDQLINIQYRMNYSVRLLER